MERLDKILACTGKWSRREAKIFIHAGRVIVDGTVIREPEKKVDPDTAEIVVDGNIISYHRFIWIMLNKPAGYLSTTEKGKSVLELLPPELRRLFPVGRLDKNTEGLLLLTNEGHLAHTLLSPRYHVKKVYYVRVSSCLTAEDCAAFASGIVLHDGSLCRPAKLTILSANKESEAYVTLYEGKFHQVRRMFAARGTDVLYLERVQFGTLSLDSSLLRGNFRFLTAKEISDLRNFAQDEEKIKSFTKK